VPKIACSFVYFCRVQIEVVKSKLHRVTITGADLHYIGSITIDQDLLDAAHMISGEKVVVVNVNNGSRLETYIIPGERGSGELTMNGPAARLVQKGDVVIVFSYALMEFEEAKAFKPWVVFPNEGSNSLK
jgi:aspartate 1-decarboxylase